MKTIKDLTDCSEHARSSSRENAVVRVVWDSVERSVWDSVYYRVCRAVWTSVKGSIYNTVFQKSKELTSEKN